MVEPASSPSVVALLAKGCFHEALLPLRRAIALGDRDPATVLNLAIAEGRSSNPDRGRALAKSIAVRMPHWDEPWLRLAENFRAVGQLLAAEDAYKQVLELNPERLEAMVALGGLLLLRGSCEDARDLLVKSCGVGPGNAEAWNTLGLALQQLDAPHLALMAFVTAQQLHPGSPEYVLNGAIVARAAKLADSELARFSDARAENPLAPAIQMGLGILLDRLGRHSEAIDALEAATELCPDELMPLQLFGGVLARSSRTRKAEEIFRRLRGLDPDNPQIRNDYAAILMRLHRHGEARALLLEGLSRDGPHSAVLCNLVNATVCVGLQDEAVDIARKAVARDPQSVMAKRVLCNALPYQEGTTGSALLEALRECSSALPRLAVSVPLHNTPNPSRPLIVGLLSGSLRSHPVGWLTIAGIETLDPDQFSVICLVQNAAPEDPIARRYRAAAQEWLEIDGLSDAGLMELARAHSIDILIDLGGYGDASRMAACANRLAPVQIKWVGMQNHTSGLAEMDWFLTDRWETPEGYESLYSERLLLMPDGYVCYSPPPHAPDVADLPASTSQHLTFGCFNNLAKITPHTIETWAEILKRTPTSRFIIKTHQLSDLPTAEDFIANFAALGISQDRIELRGSSGHRAFLGEYGDLDVVLDPFPYSGGLTTCEALWMGVPTITLPGEIFASRHSASHMSNAGLSDWVTGSIGEYIEMAVERAADWQGLAALRATLRESTRRSRLCDAPRFGQNLGAALRHVWKKWCKEVSIDTELPASVPS